MAQPSATPFDPKSEQALIAHILSPEIKDNPYNFALFAWPWGKAGTPLEHFDGPRRWQRDLMLEVADYLKEANAAYQNKLPLPPFFKSAVASGRGPGKSALVGMLDHWFRSTRLGGSSIITANTEPQLRSKTMPEIAKWTTMAINAHWFDVQALSIKPAKWLAELMEAPPRKGGLQKDTKYYYSMAQLWSEENPDAFAGAHNWNGEMYVFDEASGIPAPIWAVTEGVFTEPIPDRFWFVFSNPRRNSGAFFECFHKSRHLWRTRQIDARTVEGLDPNTYQGIIDNYGPESDEARIEVYGKFPNAGQRQFIPIDIIQGATEREPYPDPGAPLLMGVDVARFGEDRSVIAFRKGRDARSIPWESYRGLDTYQLASRIAEAARKYNPDAIFIDGGGVGGGVVDALKAMKFRPIEVQAGSSADDKDKYQNKRVEMWARMREWLPTAAIPNDQFLIDDLKAPEYEWHPLTNQLKLESKDRMKDRGLASPDMAEALAQTFARSVARRDVPYGRSATRKRRDAEEYNPFHFTG
jgi:hypothetical protein